MAGTATPDLAAAVSEVGGLGSIGVGATDSKGARAMIEAIRARTPRAFNVNLFVHAPAQPDATREAAWLTAMAPAFAEFDAEPPKDLRVIYRSFAEDDDMLAMLLETAPPVVSLHFGLPTAARTAALKSAGCLLISTATNLAEAKAAKLAGIDAIVAQGFEAGGHRGMFDPSAPDEQMNTLDLTRLLAKQAGLPVIAAGGIMDGQGIADALDHGAVAAQLGTAFIACPESAADAAYRQALKSGQTVAIKALSGRPARCLRNRFTDWAQAHYNLPCPDYPIAYDAAKALNAAAIAQGEHGFGAQWAGTQAARARALPAAELIAVLVQELAQARRS